MESKLYAITLRLKGQYYNKILKSWSILDKKLKINYLSSRSPKPHITVISGYSKNEIQIIKKVQRVKIKKFSIKSIGLGLLLKNEPLVYVRWEMNDEIKKLHQKIVKNFNKKLFKQTKFTKDPYWLPKTSIAYKDFKLKEVKTVYKYLKNLSKSLTVTINKIELMTVSSQNGEKIIFSRDLY